MTLLDPYALKARGYPAALMLLPMAVTVATAFPGALDPLTTGLLGLLGAAALYSASQWMRQIGKRKEARLWRSWGGKPTTVALRSRTAHSGEQWTALRNRVQSAVPDIALPSADDERMNPAGADRVYEDVVTRLREATRDAKRFPVVFSENVSYGFRRNAWGVRWLGFGIAAAAALLAATVLHVEPASAGPDVSVWVALGIDLLSGLFWAFVPTTRWVREAAESYRDALFAAAAILPS